MTPCSWFRFWSVLGLGLGSALTLPAIAQITPDQTLGSERSTVNRNAQTRRGQTDRIEGGARRGGSLFHSFSEFNVNQGQRVHFANPRGVDTIISRVTGLSRSEINGTLGVLGNANLFLINPNGIVFGPEAQLDLRGSFFASTSDRLQFDNGYGFSATNPDAPPLLTLNLASGLNSWLPATRPDRGTITQQGQLSVGQDLTLAAAQLELMGSLQAGGNLTLLASQQLMAQDQPTQPWLAIAGDRLLLQGNQSLGINALQHPDSGLVAGGDLVLRSNQPINADTQFRAGGSFQAERLAGGLAPVVSQQDPVFEVGGDFSLQDYTGASLQILAGGSVTIPGTVTITGAGGPFNDGMVRLSNGTALSVNGTTQPTLDIRAGTTGFFGTPAAGRPTSANIAIGRIRTPGGLVYLTNQFRPNRDLSGTIHVGQIDTSDFAGGGAVVMDSRGGLRVRGINTSSGDIGETIAIFSEGLTADNFGGNGGDVTLLAAGDIVLPVGALIRSYGLGGGAITLASETAIRQTIAPFGSSTLDLSTIESGTFGASPGGTIRLTAPQLTIGGNIVASTYGAGKTGAIQLAGENLTTNQASLLTVTFGAGQAGDLRVNAATIDLDYSFLGSSNQSPVGARGGDVIVRTNSLSSVRGGQISSQTLGLGDAGDVSIRAQDIFLSGFQPRVLTGGLFAASGISSIVDIAAEGNSGRVSIDTNTLTIENAASVSTVSFGRGDAGDIDINAREAVRVDGATFFDFEPDQIPSTSASEINSELFTGAIGNGGTVTINTPTLQVTNGGTITAQSNGQGDAGDIAIAATNAVVFDGVASFADQGQPDRISRAAVIADRDATGNGGTLTVTTPTLFLRNGAQLTAQTLGSGTAGEIRVRSAVVGLDRATISAETTSNTGGNITLNASEIAVLQNNSRISTTAGTANAGGDGGNIAIATPILAAAANQNNDITANAFTGRGGRVEISTNSIYGFRVRSRADLEAALGTTDPDRLDPVFLVTNDITAISRVNPDLSGEIVIRNLDTDAVTTAIDLPSDVVDISNLIAQGCAASGEIGRTQGSLVVTGRGGIPSTPAAPLNSRTPLVDWDSLDSPVATRSTPPATAEPPIAADPPSTAPAVPLPEVQSLMRRSDGQVILAAQPSGVATQAPWNASIACPAGR